MDKVNGIDMEFIFEKGAILPKLIDYARNETASSKRIDFELPEWDETMRGCKSTGRHRKAAYT